MKFQKNSYSIFLLTLFIGVSFNLIFAQELAKPFQTPDQIGGSSKYDAIKSVNNPLGDREDQDLKKGVAYLYYFVKSQQRFTSCTGFLLNTVNNSITTYNNKDRKRLYLATSYHCELPVFPRTQNLLDEEKRELYISFDYDYANPNKKKPADYPNQFFNPNSELNRVRRLWRIGLDPLVLDKRKDIALYEIIPRLGYPWTVENSEIFKNVYALAWNTHHRDVFNTSHQNSEYVKYIGHPKSDMKKTSKEAQFNFHLIDIIDNFSLDDHISDIGSRLSLTYVNPTIPNQYDNPFNNLFITLGGNSGGPVFNGSNQVISIHSSANEFSVGNSFIPETQGESRSILFSNSWHLYEDESREDRAEDLQTHLDPNDTWISTIKGGYITDLVKNPNFSSTDIDENYYNSYVSPSGLEQTLSLYPRDFFYFTQNPRRINNNLGNGILVANTSLPIDNDNYVTLTLTDKNNNAIYTATVSNNNIEFETTPFKEFGNNPPPQFDLLNLSETEIKKGILQHFVDKSSSQSEMNIDRLSEAELENCKLKINTANAPVYVRAIKLPLMHPWNSREVFETNPYSSLWRSNKYPEYIIENSNNLYINSVKFDLQIYVYDEDRHECNLLEPFNLLDVTSDNNGGYLNLVSPNYEIKVWASDPRCEHNKLITSLYTNDNNNSVKHYGSFVDYTKQPIPNTTSYSYTNATTRVKQGENPTTSTQIILEHDIPYPENIKFSTLESQDESAFSTRFMVGVANSILNLQGGEYPEGEFESYLLTVKKSMNDDDAINLLKGSIVVTTAVIPPGQCLPDAPGSDEDTGNNNENEEDNNPQGLDETFPAYNLPLFGINSNVCYNLLDLVNTNIGLNALIFNGQMFMDIARGSEIIHQETDYRTVSFDILPDNVIPETNQLLYEEGGINGLALRIKDGFIEFGVKIEGHDQVEIVTSTKEIDNGKMINVIAVFDRGVMQLYIDGVLQGEPNSVFASKNITSIPNHPDNAGFGAINGTSIWGNIANGFEGILDLFVLLTNRINTTTLISALVTMRRINNSGRKNIALSQAPKNSKEQSKEPSFRIFPNPAKSKLDIVVEVVRSGVIDVRIYDLTGKKVYEMKQAKINQGIQLITLRDLNFKSGNYIIKVRAGNIFKKKKVFFK